MNKYERECQNIKLDVRKVVEISRPHVKTRVGNTVTETVGWYHQRSQKQKQRNVQDC